MRSLLFLFPAVVSLAQPPAYDVIASKRIMVPMRDGVRLATDIYRPGRDGAPVEGKFPAIVERTPYLPYGDWNAQTYVPRGYVLVIQSVRGRFGSEGHWTMFQDDARDGADLARWLGKQPWFDGGIGTIGTSYPGGTQHAMAVGNAPYLKAMVPVDAASNMGLYGARHNGAFELRFFNWIFIRGGAPDADNPLEQAEWKKLADMVPEYLKSLPLRTGTTPLHMDPDYEAWLVEAMRHGDYDDWWKRLPNSVVEHVAEYEDVPVYHVTGWYDSWAAQVANLNYPVLSKAKKGPHKLIIGPWVHGGQEDTSAGEAEFGPEAAAHLTAVCFRWFDHWLKGVDNGVDREPPVRIFVMGGGGGKKVAEGRVFVGGHWRNEQEWPLQRAKPMTFYLHAGGGLSAEKPKASAPTPYQFDPKDPVPTIGGNISSAGNLMFPGAFDQRCRPNLLFCKDQRPLAARNDVLVFRTSPLANDTEVTGTAVVNLWASSSAADTDFTAKLVDVYPPSADFPAGVELNVADSIVRARYRDSLEKASLMQPRQVYRFQIRMYPTSLVFARGHRIRLDISSSNFPRFDVNPNTGEPLNDNRRWAVADNTIYHEPGRESQIILPVVQ
jgi:putative CocE/NonD family hydrolase